MCPPPQMKWPTLLKMQQKNNFLEYVGVEFKWLYLFPQCSANGPEVPFLRGWGNSWNPFYITVRPMVRNLPSDLELLKPRMCRLSTPREWSYHHAPTPLNMSPYMKKGWMIGTCKHTCNMQLSWISHQCYGVKQVYCRHCLVVINPPFNFHHGEIEWSFHDVLAQSASHFQ